jgi:hypothetical protein
LSCPNFLLRLVWSESRMLASASTCRILSFKSVSCDHNSSRASCGRSVSMAFSLASRDGIRTLGWYLLKWERCGFSHTPKMEQAMIWSRLSGWPLDRHSRYISVVLPLSPSPSLFPFSLSLSPVIHPTRYIHLPQLLGNV